MFYNERRTTEVEVWAFIKRNVLLVGLIDGKKHTNASYAKCDTLVTIKMAQNDTHSTCGNFSRHANLFITSDSFAVVVAMRADVYRVRAPVRVFVPMKKKKQKNKRKKTLNLITRRTRLRGKFEFSVSIENYTSLGVFFAYAIKRYANYIRQCSRIHSTECCEWYTRTGQKTSVFNLCEK